MKDKVITINLSQIARNFQTAMYKMYHALRKIIFARRTPIRIVQLTTMGIMLLAFFLAIPACVFVSGAVCTKIGIASIIATSVYLITEGALCLIRKSKRFAYRTPIELMRIAFLGDALLVFAMMFPACLIMDEAFCVKIGMVGLISIGTYLITEGILYITKKKK